MRVRLVCNAKFLTPCSIENLLQSIPLVEEIEPGVKSSTFNFLENENDYFRLELLRSC